VRHFVRYASEMAQPSAHRRRKRQRLEAGAPGNKREFWRQDPQNAQKMASPQTGFANLEKMNATGLAWRLSAEAACGA